MPKRIDWNKDFKDYFDEEPVSLTVDPTYSPGTSSFFDDGGWAILIYLAIIFGCGALFWIVVWAMIIAPNTPPL